jgi:tetratricopeptide (TPR) repeat protein
MRNVLLFLSTLALALSLSGGTFEQSTRGTDAVMAAREEAYRANNIGVALLEQFKYPEAAAEFRRALKAEPGLTIARINLGIALYNSREMGAASREIRLALGELPNSPHAHYMNGLIARAQNLVPDAINSFQKVLTIDPRDSAANVNLGQLYTLQRKYVEAIGVLESAVASEPYSVTATYSLAIALTRAQKTAEGQAMMRKFQDLRQKPYAVTLGQSYLEQGRYAEAISSTGKESSLVDTTIPDVTFTNATSTMLRSERPRASVTTLAGKSFRPPELNDELKGKLAAAVSGGVALIDADGDGDFDILSTDVSGVTLLRNDVGSFTDVTSDAGFGRLVAAPITAVAGDFDNDGRADIFVVGLGRAALFHNDGGCKFSDVTASAGIGEFPDLARSAAFIDVDHDGDLDVFVSGFVTLNQTAFSANDKSFVFPLEFPAANNRLLLNLGNGKFRDATTSAKLGGSLRRAVALVPTDFDNHRDIDILVVNESGPSNLFSNQRDGSFRDVAGEVGLEAIGASTCVAAGDYNKDDFTDFFLGQVNAPGVIAASDGRGRFVAQSAPESSAGAIAAQFLDYDQDGLLDLVILRRDGLRVLRNLGEKWQDVTSRAVARDLERIVDSEGTGQCSAMAAADIDGDGDQDLVIQLRGGGLIVGRNDGGSRNNALKVLLTSKVSNRSSLGAKVEVRAGSLQQKIETFSATPAPAPADIIFGLGKRSSADAVRVLWPAGIVQSETEPGKANARGRNLTVVAITEIDRKPSSCPYLFTWNGKQFEFVTDFLGGGEMGYWEAPGVRNHPDPDEYVRIRDDQLQLRNGKLELRITNELEEVLYLDHIRLMAIEHPSDVDVFPNEGMTEPPRGFKLFATRGAHPPLAARDEHGHDVLDKVSHMDRQYPNDFTVHSIRGYSEAHTLTLDLGRPVSRRTLLVLTGWTDYAFSSDNVAAHQAGLSLSPPRLEVRNAKGAWVTAVDDIGIPVGRPQTMVIDLTGKFPTLNREVRIVTNMRINWDQILVDDASVSPIERLTPLRLTNADLRWRGFSAETSPDGHEPFLYDYSRVSPFSPWKVMPGRYTREGDVRELLGSTDDMLVVARSGDEIALSFDGSSLPPLDARRRRTFLLYANGFSKEMDINSASPDCVEPLPFHTMKHYPDSAYPLGRRRQSYIDRYNTRVVAAPVPRIDATFAGREGQTGRVER